MFKEIQLPLVGEIIKVGTSSLVVEVSLFLEEMYSDEKVLAVKGSFTLVAIDDDRKPVKIIN